MTPETEAKKRRTLSLSRTMTLGLAILLLVSIGVSSWVIWSAARRNTYDLLGSVARISVNTVAQEVDSYIQVAQKQIGFIAQVIASGEVGSYDSERLKDIMLGSLAAAPQVDAVAFVRPDYSVLRAERRNGVLITYVDNWSKRPDVRAAMDNERALDDPTWRAIGYVDEFEGTYVFLADGVRRQGKFVGLLFSVISTRSLSGFLADQDAEGPMHSFVLVNRTQVLAHSSLAQGYADASEAKPLPSIGEIHDPLIASIWDKSVDDMSAILDGEDITGRIVEGKDQDYVYLYRNLAEIGLPDWIVGVAIESGDIDRPYQRLIMTGLIGVGILVLAIGVGLYIARAIVRPLRSLAQASRAVSDLTLAGIAPLPESRFRELDVASRAFNTMVSGLRWFETYVPRSLVLRLMRSDERVQSEERQVTVLFTDIVGFTGIGSQLSPTDLAQLLNRHFTLLAEAIEAEEGTVDKYIGDSIMAFWGAPFDQPDHAERACRAALEMARLVQAENQARRARGEEIIRLRIGLHSGQVVAGNIGAPGRVNYTLIGDTVNSAQRLEALGKDVDPEAEVIVLLGAETRQALPPGFTVLARGLFRLRGRDQAMEVYQLLSDDGPMPEEARVTAQQVPTAS